MQGSESSTNAPTNLESHCCDLVELRVDFHSFSVLSTPKPPDFNSLYWAECGLSPWLATFT